MTTEYLINDQQTWITDEAVDFMRRIAFYAHCGNRGDRSYDAALDIVAQSCWWTDVREDIKEFTQLCIYCIVSRNGKGIPRPLSTALHASKPDGVVHAESLYIEPATDCIERYILVIKDDISSYTWLQSCKSTDSGATISILSR